MSTEHDPERQRQQHELKCWPESFAAVQEGRKLVELRRNDRDYHEGDLLLLREYLPSDHNPETGGYTGRTCTVEITHLVRGGFGLADQYLALSIRLRLWHP